MFKNYLIITTSSQSMRILPDTSWQQKDVLYKLLCDYIPIMIKEIVPMNDKYLITWKDESSYNALLSDRNYIDITKILGEYSISVKFLPM